MDNLDDSNKMNSPQTPPAAKRLGEFLTPRRVKLLIWCVVVILAVIFVWQNWTEVETPILFMKVTMPRSLLILLMIATGFVIGIFSPFRRGAKDKN